MQHAHRPRAGLVDELRALARSRLPLETDPATLAALLWHDLALADAARAGAIRIDGNRAVVERFLELFPPPAPASAADPLVLL